MPIISKGFRGRPGGRDPALPPGQYRTLDFPVLSTGPSPHVDPERWSLTLVTETGETTTWDRRAFQALPQERPTVDIHCVTKWSKFGTSWRGVSLDVLLDGVETQASFVKVASFGGYTTNLPLADLRGGRAWVVHEYDGRPLTPEHGGPARLLVPHLYFWKSAKWVRELQLLTEDEPGFWETNGYHDYGDPWREQRYQGD
ncbi:sulfite oxidase-like oxidoreductase [Solicola sp. PLA-1-18]|uniref:sulfite oxidase-like oxidoreductase n=1 Tax=Solicola sp. PLA-1-18 TaxID=3380532 RepID=UPI003B7E4F48